MAFPGVYINGLIEKDFDDAIAILNEDQDKSKPVIVLVSQQRVSLTFVQTIDLVIQALEHCSRRW